MSPVGVNIVTNISADIRDPRINAPDIVPVPTLYLTISRTVEFMQTELISTNIAVPVQAIAIKGHMTI
jgi:hypothetical protein